LSHGLGLPPAITGLFTHLTERWDGKGPERLAQEQLPLPLRIIHVARDAAVQRMLGGSARAAAVVRRRSGAAFDPAVAQALIDDAEQVLALDEHQGSVWDATLAAEPDPPMVLEGHALDEALAAMGEFADLVSPHLTGHSAAVAQLATDAARHCGLAAAEVTALRRASLVHDVGRVAVPSRIWQKPARLTPDEWERVRLHAYHSERILCRSRFLNRLAPLATAHHERLDGRGYHRGVPAPGLPFAARLLAAADACAAMRQARPHRPALTGQQTAQALQQGCAAGALDPEAVAAVLAAAGQSAPRLERPAGLTEREVQVVALLARGLQTKQVARALGISAKTADHHVQNAYAKIGVSTRAGAAVFAMQQGLTSWGELPMEGRSPRP
jgi:HD-GYP domain-containing protein (c-di-GMP phosphodiesterase class II)